MDPRGPAPQPFQRPEKPGGVCRRKTRREHNEDPLVAPTAPKLVVITQGWLSREHRGLFNHEMKSLDVARLLSGGPLEPGIPSLPAIPSPSPSWAQEPALQSRGKENQMPGGSGPGPPIPSPAELPGLGQLLEELQCQLILPQAFPRRNLVQEARDAIVSTLQACHGCEPDLSLPGGPESQRMILSWINSPDQCPGEGRQRRQQRTKELTFAMPHSSSTPMVHRVSLAPPKGPWPPTLPLLPSPSGHIWLVATPSPQQYWGVGPQTAPASATITLVAQNLCPGLESQPPAPLPSLSWVVAQSSPEAWSFPPMTLY
ncbi:unnamed protein product [Nyctereutes procyonoides]|uniref:(raccoon dog) hypothetical protein n=1 Tax=Nyctereutes procyonoides TaxID=34880 RepID=A0A811YWA1_NYCPR|nr:unnamed protein product [Nyctereutes procyonoides]